MKIIDICNLLREELYNSGYIYGFIANNKKYTPDKNKGFDADYYQSSLTIYRVQPICITKKEKIGTCIETTLVMKELLDKHKIPNKIWLLHQKDKNKVHTILTFEAEGKVVYLELTPQSSKEWYGKEIIYSSVEQFCETYEKNNYDVLEVTEDIIVGEQPEFLLKRIQ